MRLSQAARKLNVGHNTILEFLAKKGFEVENNPNAKLTPEQVNLLSKEFASSATEKLEASGLSIGVKHSENIVLDKEKEAPKKRVDDEESNIMIKNLGSKDLKAKEEIKPEKIEREKTKLEGIKVVGKIELEKKTPPVKEEEKVEAPAEIEKVVAKIEPAIDVKEKVEPVKEKIEEPVVKEEPPVKKIEVTPIEEKQPEQELIKGRADKLQGLKVLDRIQLPEKKKDAPVASSDTQKDNKGKRPRKRIASENQGGQQGTGQQGQQQGAPQRGPRPVQQPQRGARPNQSPRVQKAEPTEKEIQDQIKATLAKLSGGGNKKGSGAKYRREKRQANSDAQEQQMLQEQEASKTLKVTEFISANDLASMMNVSVNDVISTCLSLGMFVSINQRLDAEAITVITDEFGYSVQFTSAEEELEMEEDIDNEEDLQPRAP
ncbi:MAG: translation initiation factor IF-2, partial [Marivirga sp.]|nr:translation initiation factor IF-2 [Marivirga sp.]